MPHFTKKRTNLPDITTMQTSPNRITALLMSSVCRFCVSSFAANTAKRHIVLLFLTIAAAAAVPLALQAQAPANPHKPPTDIQPKPAATTAAAAGEGPQSATLLSVNYNYELPLADLAQRFGNSSRIGVALLRRTKNNFTYGLEAQYLFGNRVKEDSLLQNLFTDDGNLVGNSGYNANIRFGQQGLSAALVIGKIFPLKSTQPNKGIWVNITAGYLWHQIGFRDRQNDMPQLTGDYKKGYDRLSGGLATSVHLAYVYLSDNKRINFHIGPIFTLANTRSLRKYNYDTRTADTQSRRDMLVGIKLGWMLPFYDKNVISKAKKYYTK